MNILVVEDQQRIADFIVRGLKAERHAVTLARTGEEGLELALATEFDVIVLDLMLPGMHGLEVCQTLRERGRRTPILVLSALDAVADKIKGLRLGADDYLGKPFDFDELLARLDALSRRATSTASGPTRLEVGDLVLDRETFEVTRGGTPLKITAKELAILELLMAHPGKVFSRERILSDVWGASEDPLTNVVDVYIARLRRRIDRDDEPSMIDTLRGQGYRIRDPTG
jgi:DNA-binding response OmpR family regulator